MAAETPPAVMTSPSSTTRSDTTVRQYGASSSWALGCVVVRRPVRKPAAPRSRAPVQTETLSGTGAALFSQPMNAASCCSSRVAKPPGTKSRSYESSGSFATSGPRRRPRSSATRRVAEQRRHSKSGMIRIDFRRVTGSRSEEHTSELQSPCNLVCRLLLEKKKKKKLIVLSYKQKKRKKKKQ